jgi:hypothetical protein
MIGNKDRVDFHTLMNQILLLSQVHVQLSCPVLRACQSPSEVWLHGHYRAISFSYTAACLLSILIHVYASCQDLVLTAAYVKNTCGTGARRTTKANLRPRQCLGLRTHKHSRVQRARRT